MSVAQLKKRIYNHRALVVIFFISFTVFFLGSLLKHINFYSTGYDLSIFDQVVRSYSQLRTPESALRGFDNILGDHFHPILALLAPLYWIYDSPVMLLIAQALLVASAVIPIYLFCLHLLKSKRNALLVALVYVLNPALHRMVMFDFHEIAFAIPLTAWAIYFMYTKRWLLFFIVIAGLLLTKESLSLLVVFFGIVLLLRRELLKGFVLIGVGTSSFLVILKMIIPHFSDSSGYSYWRYTQIGEDITSAIINSIKNPLLPLTILFTPVAKVATLIKTVGIFFGLNLLSPLILLTVPLLLERFLSDEPNHWSFTYHYGGVIAPVLVLALADSLPRLTRLLKKCIPAIKNTSDHNVHSVLIAPVLVVAVAIFMFSPLIKSVVTVDNYTIDSGEQHGHQIVADFKRAENVCTTNHLSPHFQGRYVWLLEFSESLENCNTVIMWSQRGDTQSIRDKHSHALEKEFSYEERGGWLLYQRT